MKYYEDDYDDAEAYPLKDETVRKPELQLETLRGLDWLLALILAGFMGGLLTLWAFPGLSPDAWDDAAIAPMRPEAAVEFLWHDKLKGAADVNAKRKELAKEYKQTLASAEKAAQIGVIDAVIAKSGTRQAVVEALDLLEGKRVSNMPKKHSNIPF